MKKLKLLIVANNCVWKTWPEKIEWLEKYYSDCGFSLKTKIIHSQFKDVPFIDYPNSEGKKMLGVDHHWYNENVTSLALKEGSDLVVFQMNAREWNGKGARGWRTDKDQGVVEMQVGCDEKEKFTAEIEKQGKKVRERFQGWEWFTVHEISHAIYFKYGVPDRTHELYNKYGIDGLKEGLTPLSLTAKIIDSINNKTNMYATKSSRDPSLLESQIQERWYELEKWWNSQSNKPRVFLTQTTRDRTDQEKAKAQGASRANFGQSLHNFSPAFAFDIAFTPNGRDLDWSWENFRQFAQKAEELDLQWGGDWDGDNRRDPEDFDGPHIQLPMTWQNARDQKIPKLKVKSVPKNDKIKLSEVTKEEFAAEAFVRLTK